MPKKPAKPDVPKIALDKATESAWLQERVAALEAAELTRDPQYKVPEHVSVKR